MTKDLLLQVSLPLLLLGVGLGCGQVDYGGSPSCNPPGSVEVEGKWTGVGREELLSFFPNSSFVSPQFLVTTTDTTLVAANLVAGNIFPDRPLIAFDLAARRWTQAGEIPPDLMQPASLATSNDFTLLAGLDRYNQPSEIPTTTRRITLFDRLQGNWEDIELPDEFDDRVEPLIVNVANQFFVWGGMVDYTNQSSEVRKDARNGYLFDPQTRSWRALPRRPAIDAIPESATFLAGDSRKAAWRGGGFAAFDGKVAVVSSWTEAQDGEANNLLGVYSIEDDSWTEVPMNGENGSPPGRFSANVAHHEGVLYFWGGALRATSPDRATDLWALDLDTEEWRRIAVPAWSGADLGVRVGNRLVFSTSCGARHFYDLSSETWGVLSTEGSASNDPNWGPMRGELHAIGDTLVEFNVQDHGGASSNNLYLFEP